jgi:DNA-binding CsgD family transcriptional regulator
MMTARVRVETAQPAWAVESLTKNPIASIAVADFDDDGVIDLAFTEPERRAVHVLLYTTTGSVKRHDIYEARPLPRPLLATDIQRRGVPDLIVGCLGGIQFLLAEGEGRFVLGPTIEVRGAPSALAVEPDAAGGRRLLAVVAGRILCFTLDADAGHWTRAAVDDIFSGRSPGPRLESLRLTGRQEQIVRMAVDGLAAKQIARALSISTRTVESHLAHVYGKLGVRTRLELARWYEAQRRPENTSVRLLK